VLQQHRLAHQRHLVLEFLRVLDALLLGFLREDLAQTTWSFACASISGVTGWPERVPASAARRRAPWATGLPLTVAMFWAMTASGSARVPTINAAEVLSFMLRDFRAKLS
jgi:hypothetical protein